MSRELHVEEEMRKVHLIFISRQTLTAGRSCRAPQNRTHLSSFCWKIKPFSTSKSGRWCAVTYHGCEDLPWSSHELATSCASLL